MYNNRHSLHDVSDMLDNWVVDIIFNTDPFKQNCFMGHKLVKWYWSVHYKHNRDYNSILSIDSHSNCLIHPGCRFLFNNYRNNLNNTQYDTFRPVVFSRSTININQHRLIYFKLNVLQFERHCIQNDSDTYSF